MHMLCKGILPWILSNFNKAAPIQFLHCSRLANLHVHSLESAVSISPCQVANGFGSRVVKYFNVVDRNREIW